MKPDRIQIFPELGNGQGTTSTQQIVKRYPVKSLVQAAILAGVFSDLIQNPTLQLVAMIIESHELTLIVAAAGGGPLTEAEYDVIETFDVVYEMVMAEPEDDDFGVDFDDDFVIP